MASLGLTWGKTHAVSCFPMRQLGASSSTYFIGRGNVDTDTDTHPSSWQKIASVNPCIFTHSRGGGWFLAVEEGRANGEPFLELLLFYVN